MYSRKVETALWWDRIRKTSNRTFLPLFFDEHRFLVLKGGGGSGKSVFAARKVIERCVTEPGHRILVCRKVKDSIRDSVWENLLDQLQEFYPGRYRDYVSNFRIRFDNGSEIICVGLDDVEKKKSITNIDSMWIEEASELLESDFNQLNIRMRGKSPYYKQIILTFNPIIITHWLKKRFFDSKDPRAKTHESTYKDNRFMLEEDIQTLLDFKFQDDYFYEVYALGQWGSTGKSVFDARTVQRRLQENIRPVRTGMMVFDYDGLAITKIRFEDDRDGYIRIYKAPEKGVPYVLGADTAGDGSDWFVAHILDNRTGEQVAVLRQQFDEDVFAKQVYCLGKWYNDALVGVEANWSTYPIMELERLGYPRLYVRESYDNYTHKAKKSYGFLTGPKNRNAILAELIRVVREDIRLVSDKDTLEEMLTFVRNEHFRPEAEEGAHDDCIMALAIAHAIRPQQRYTETVQEDRKEWSDSMKEDYWNASREERAMLIRLWGRPSNL